MPDALFLGPLALPPMIVPSIIALTTGYLVLRVFLPGVTDSARIEWIGKTSYRALLGGFVLWKVWPLFRWWEAILAEPVILLRLPGGPGGVAAGVTVAVLLFLPGLRRDRERIRPLLMTALPAIVAFLFTLAVMHAVGESSTQSIQADRLASILEEAEYLPAPSSAALPTSPKPLVLTFWASWCAPCVAELPVKKDFFDRYGDQLRYIAINMTRSERSREAVQRFVAEKEMSYPVILDIDGTLTTMFAIRGTPTTVVVDGTGTVRDRWMGASSPARLERAARRALE